MVFRQTGVAERCHNLVLGDFVAAEYECSQNVIPTLQLKCSGLKMKTVFVPCAS